MQLTTNFKLSEFVCGEEPKGMHLINVKMLAGELQKLRNAIGKSITIVLGYCGTNEDTGASSTHTNGMGACIRSTGLTPEQLALKAMELMEAGKMVKGNIIVYDDRVHLDIRGAISYMDKRTQTAPAQSSGQTNTGGGYVAPNNNTAQNKETPWYLSGTTPILLVGGLIAILYFINKSQQED